MASLVSALPVTPGRTENWTGVTMNNAHKTGTNGPLRVNYAHMRENNHMGDKITEIYLNNNHFLPTWHLMMQRDWSQYLNFCIAYYCIKRWLIMWNNFVYYGDGVFQPNFNKHECIIDWLINKKHYSRVWLQLFWIFLTEADTQAIKVEFVMMFD